MNNDEYIFKDKKRGRSWRRKQEHRYRKKAYDKYIGTHFFYDPQGTKDQEHIKLCNFVRLISNNMAKCSCFMCGNEKEEHRKNRLPSYDKNEINEAFIKINQKK